MNQSGDTVVLDESGIMQTDTIQEADNVDGNNPLKLKFYIDDKTIRVDKINLNFSLEKFRAYSKGTESGGGSTQTSSSGGGTNTSTNSGGGTSKSTNSGGGSTNTSSTISLTSISEDVEPIGELTVPVSNNSITLHGSTFRHHHAVDIGSHGHSVSIPAHSHSFSIPNHSHDFSVSNHSHSVTVPSHSHPITYGIYTSTTATGVKIMVNGSLVDSSAYTSDQSNIDLTQHVNNTGWNTIELTSTRLGRINASLFVKSFAGT
ncbi:hypothetical protein [Paraliobacillus sp. X-1268]|uniref:hypothetical protein n=1 Tax=Paraliobacillus sp. X-1268 TaxID=2213193 RepID=UPI000E3D0C07|nr:hypothetical protein [Paraliobacillus sp. X-1268]